MKRMLMMLFGLLSLGSVAQSNEQKEKAMKGLESIMDYEFSNPSDFCIDSTNSFEDLFVLGAFANDAGCLREGLMYKDTVGLDSSLQVKVLHNHGWASDSIKSTLAMAWVQEVLLCWSTPVLTYHEDFGYKTTPNYDAPKSMLMEHGVRVELWVRRPPGMLPQNIYYKLTVLFDTEGNVISSTRTKQFSAPS